MAASSSSSSFSSFSLSSTSKKYNVFYIYNILVILIISPLLLLLIPTSVCEEEIICEKFTYLMSFGDSLTDTGNRLRLAPPNNPPPFCVLPYGQTFFHYATGRSCDGRLIIDFLAEYLGIPFLPPYIRGENDNKTENFQTGVNFAVGGATALDKSFFEGKGVDIPVRYGSLGTQLGWFKTFLPSQCQTSSDCEKLFERTLFLVGEIGGNDYNHAVWAGLAPEVVKTFVSPVVDIIVSTVNELLDMGAKTLVVPGNLPIGCIPSYLMTFMPNSSINDYDQNTGCLKWLNQFSMHHNTLLMTELDRIRELHPDATIIYADYYNAAMQLFLNPDKFGFSKDNALRACCGGKGKYNFSSIIKCGQALASVCEDPSLYINWDGLHLTEAAYRFIFEAIFKGPHTVPPFSSLCKTSNIQDI